MPQQEIARVTNFGKSALSRFNKLLQENDEAALTRMPDLPRETPRNGKKYSKRIEEQKCKYDLSANKFAKKAKEVAPKTKHKYTAEMSRLISR